ELYLAYDGGQIGTTIQKMSRTLTPAEVDKVGRVFSLSFDPNRDDKFDAMIIETARNYKKRHKMLSLREAMKTVLSTINIFTCGRVKLDVDAYLEQALARNGIARVIGKIVNLGLLSDTAITALANGNSDYFRNEKQAKAKKGKTRLPQQTKKGKAASDNSNKELANARKTIVAIVENIDVIMGSCDDELVVDALASLDNENDRKWVMNEFGIDLDVIYYLFDAGVIKQDWVELVMEKG
ncbi:MAG: hypothetical protein LC650_05855, partial [Actinobacteria bacterium]|nr:hypothetical protein [Actinomycetota bacterium]